MTEAVELRRGGDLVASAPSLSAAALAVVTMADEDGLDPADYTVRLSGADAIRLAYEPPPVLRTSFDCVVVEEERPVSISTAAAGAPVVHPGCRAGRPPEACLCAKLAVTAATCRPETALGLISGLWAEVAHLAPEDPRHREVLQRAVRIALEASEAIEARTRQTAEARERAARSSQEQQRAALDAFGITTEAA